MDLLLDKTSKVPLYQQITQGVKRLIATGELAQGAHLPPIRILASSLGINPGTVLRAYLELAREGVVVSRPGSGTEVAASSEYPRIVAERARRLNSMLSESILSALSQGYTPEELEASFVVQLAQWRGGEKSQPEVTVPYHADLNIAASDDLALGLLVARFKALRPEVTVQLDYSGSLGGLIALQQGRADLAGIHLLDIESGEYNYSYIKRLLPGVGVCIVTLAHRTQGLIVAQGNPKKISDLRDLRRPGITMVNRQVGSGTRVLLDLKLQELGIRPDEIKGYTNAVKTHVEVANAVASGKADVGLAIATVTKGMELSFVPLLKERYDLVIPANKLGGEKIGLLLEIIKSRDFKNTIAELDGYDNSETGVVRFLNGKEG